MVPNNADKLSEDERFELSLLTFQKALKLLQLTPKKQCEVFENYNVAWELKDELETGKYLLDISEGKLNRDQQEIIKVFLDRLNRLPENLTKEALTFDENIAVMNDPFWSDLKSTAAEILKLLPKK